MWNGVRKANLPNCFAVFTLNERDSSINSGGVASIPVVADTTSGKKVIRQVMVRRGASPVPKITINSGAIATTGVDWITTNIGNSALVRNLEFTIMMAKGILTKNEIPKPSRAMRSVAHKLSNHLSIGTWLKASAISDGAGSINVGTEKIRHVASHIGMSASIATSGSQFCDHCDKYCFISIPLDKFDYATVLRIGSTLPVSLLSASFFFSER